MAQMWNWCGARYEARHNLADSVCEVDGQAPLQAVMMPQTVPSLVDTPLLDDERLVGDWQSSLDHCQWGEKLETEDMQGPEDFHQLLSTHGRDTWCLGASVSLLKEPESDIPDTCSTNWATTFEVPQQRPRLKSRLKSASPILGSCLHLDGEGNFSILQGKSVKLNL